MHEWEARGTSGVQKPRRDCEDVSDQGSGVCHMGVRKKTVLCGTENWSTWEGQGNG